MCTHVVVILPAHDVGKWDVSKAEFALGHGEDDGYLRVYGEGAT